jgi:hypothetical protein
METTGQVEHQGTVVDIPTTGVTGAEAVIQQGQGLVFKTEAGRFGTLGADGFYHGYVPSTQVRDILNGAGEDAEAEPKTALDEALEKAKQQGAEHIAGSEAPAPTGDVDNETDPSPMVSAAQTDRDPTLTPLTADEAKKANAKASEAKS